MDTPKTFINCQDCNEKKAKAPFKRCYQCNLTRKETLPKCENFETCKGTTKDTYKTCFLCYNNKKNSLI